MRWGQMIFVNLHGAAFSEDVEHCFFNELITFLIIHDFEDNFLCFRTTRKALRMS